MSGEAGIVLLAAGASTRMGVPKQLLDYGGKPLVRHATETALASGCGPVLVVLGCGAGAVVGALDSLPVALVLNPAWEEGMGGSVRAGVRAAEELDLKAVIIALADQPQVSAEAYRKLLERHDETGASVVASAYGGTRGAPALFSRELFPTLINLAPQEGCQALIQGHPGVIEVECAEALADVDTPDDYRTVCGCSSAGCGACSGIGVDCGSHSCCGVG